MNENELDRFEEEVTADETGSTEVEAEPEVRHFRAVRTMPPAEPETEAEQEEQTPAEEIAQIYEDKEPEEPAETENALSPKATVFDWVKTVLFSFAAVIFTFTVLFRGSSVVGSSMRNTLHDGERVIISSFLYTPKAGDIVVLHTPCYKDGEEFLIKRIIALGGQTVKINFNTWQIWVDGELMDEPYVLKESGPMHSESLVPDENGEVEFTVMENHVFVMGDNRNGSLDSRNDQIGQINQQYILGRVILRYLPFNVFGPVD